nr:MAG TPA: hypothetical protein [Caudoviricetes sp.]
MVVLRLGLSCFSIRSIHSRVMPDRDANSRIVYPLMSLIFLK